MLVSLKLEAQRSLHLPGGPGRGDLSKRSIDLLARRIKTRGRVKPGILRMIKHVVSLPAELNFGSFLAASQRDVLKQGPPVAGN